MGHVSTGKLQNSLSLKRVLQWLFANRTLAADKSPLAPKTAPVHGTRHDVVVNGANSAEQSTGS